MGDFEVGGAPNWKQLIFERGPSIIDRALDLTRKVLEFPKGPRKCTMRKSIPDNHRAAEVVCPVQRLYI